MQYQRLTGEQRRIRNERSWVYARASQIQSEKWVPRQIALRQAWKDLRQQRRS